MARMSCCGLAGLVLGQIFEIGARHLVQFEGKRIGGQLVERGRQFVDGVVGPRQRAVAAAIERRDLEVGVDLLRGFDVGHDGAAVVEFHAAGVGIDDEGRIDQVAMLAAPASRRR